MNRKNKETAGSFLKLITLRKHFKFFPLIFLLLPANSPAQILDTRVTEPALTELKFNTDYIRYAKVKKITLHIAQKPDLQVIEEKGLVQCYEFDTTGLLKRYYFTTIVSQEKTETYVNPVYRRGKRIRPGYTIVDWKYVYDTSFTWFAYDNYRHLVMKRSNYGDFFNTYYYEYDSTGRLVKETNCRETNRNLNKHDFMLGVQTVLSSESFQYLEQSTTQLKKLFYNDDGKVYKQGIINRDSNTVEENYSFVVGYVRYTNIYKYDQNGRLAEKNSYSNSNGDVKLTVTYEYDENGNLAGEKRYRNEVNTDAITYLYSETQRLVKSELDRDFVNLSVGIIKFTYEFYP